ncbi:MULTISPECIES: hypothetical protein [unclassified Streptomyces]|uniref:hypothetical protein n=1 Tax=unclassified Streptomyces TaxID=2593676 RepID=UPI0036E4263F
MAQRLDAEGDEPHGVVRHYGSRQQRGQAQGGGEAGALEDRTPGDVRLRVVM